MTWLECVTGDDTGLDCWRTGISSWLSLITLVFCVLQAYTITLRKKKIFSFQLVSLYLACLQTLVACIYYFFSHDTWITYLRLYLEQNVFLTIAFYYARFALRSIKGQEYQPRTLYPWFGALYVGCFGIVLGCSLSPRAFRCHNRLWLAYGLLQFVLSMILLISGIVIWRTLRGMVLSKSVRQSKKMQLWALIIVWLFSSIYSLSFQTYVATQYPDEDSCDDFFSTSGAGKVVLFCGTYLISSLVPLWAMLIVFYSIQSKPRPNSTVQDPYEYDIVVD